MRGWLRRVHPYTPELARLRALMLAAAEAPLPHGEASESADPLPNVRALVTQAARCSVLMLRLELPGVRLSDADAAVVGAALRHLPSLEVLDLRGCCMEPSAVLSLAAPMSRAHLSTLQTLLLGGNWNEAQLEVAVRCTEAICAALVLAGARSLSRLSIPNGMLPQGATALCEALAALHPPLTHLDVSDSRFGCGGMLALLDASRRSPFDKLERLDLFACHIGPRGGESLGRFLSASGTRSSQDGTTLAPKPPPLLSLSLGDNAIQDRGLAALAAALVHNPRLAATLIDIDLSSNGIGLQDDTSLFLPGGGSACDEFARALQLAGSDTSGGGGVALQWLNFSQNFLGKDGMRGVVSALRAAPLLTCLDVACCNLHDGGVHALAEHLAASGSPALSTLGIYNQPEVTDGAARALMLALREGVPNLTALHAGRINMLGDSDDSAAAAAVALVEERPRLKYLDLRDNAPLDASLTRRVDEVCRLRPGLRLFNPTDPWPGEEANDVFSAMEGWHQAGLVDSRQMFCRFQQTIWFYRGDDRGGELNQPVYVIEEPGGELNHVAGGMATGSEEVSESPSPSDNLHAP